MNGVSRFQNLALQGPLAAVFRLRTLACLLLFAVPGGVVGQTLPKGVTLPASTLSPDGRYGVTVPSLSDYPDDGKFADNDEPHNQLVDASTGQTLATIHAETGWDRMDRGRVLPARWSPDGALLLWEVEGRWSPTALVLLKVQANKVQWELDVLDAMQKAILTRTREAAPRKYAAAMRRNKGNGSAFPDGFTVNVRAAGDKERGGDGDDVRGKPISLPLRVHAELTSDPKQMGGPKNTRLDSELDGVINQEGKLRVSHFHVRDEPFDHAMASSWLELTHPAAALHAPLEYGDVISLTGHINVGKNETGKPTYILRMPETISVPATIDDPAENHVSEIRLLKLELDGIPTPDFSRVKIVEVWGVLGHSHTAFQRPAVTLKVSSYGYSNP